MKKTALDIVASVPWAIDDAALNTVVSIAERVNDKESFLEDRIKALESVSGDKLAGTRGVTMRGNTAIVPVIGSIFRYANLFTEISGATSLELLAKDFSKAAADEDVENIVLVIDSPGGQATGISEFADMIKAADKPVFAYVDGMAASAAYWIASAADKVLVSKTAELGSIGAVLGINTDEPDGVVKIISSQSPLKQAMPTNKEGKKELQARIDTLAQIFIEDVAENRGVDIDTVLKDFGRGGIRIGQEAVDLSMADEVTSFESLLLQLSIGADSMSEQKKTGAKAQEQEPVAITVESVKADYPEIAAALIAEGKELGAKAELNRVKSVKDQMLAGHEDLVNELMFDGVTTGEQAAIKIINAERDSRDKVLSELKEDAEEPLDDVQTDTVEPKKESGDFANAEEEAAHLWENDSKIRKEFDNDKDAFVAFHVNMSKGLIKIK